LKPYGIVYLAKLPSGKVYVGCTKYKLGHRRSQHRHAALIAKSKTKFYNAIRYYGYEAVSWEVLATCFSAEALFETEAYFIALYNSIKTGYNQLTGSHAYIRKDKLSIERLEELRLLNSGENNPMYGRVHSSETRKRISDSLKGKGLGLKRPPFTAEHKANIGAKSRGRVASKETREKLSRAGKGRIVSEKSRQMAAKSVPHRIPIRCLNNNVVYTSQTAAAKALGLNIMSIHNHLKGKNKDVKGYKFVKESK
jgi:group I intron endonuclease